MDGHDPREVRRAVGHALKLDPQRTARLFSGTRVVVKRGVDGHRAHRYMARFAMMGAVLRALPDEPRPRRKAAASQAAPRPPARPLGDLHWRWPPWPLLTVLGLVCCGVVALVTGLARGGWWPELGAPSARSGAPGPATPSRDPSPLRAAEPIPEGAPAAASGPVATTPAPAATAPSPLADADIPKDMSADALRDYRQGYLLARQHKAFALSSRGQHNWTAGAASEAEARDATLALCATAAFAAPGDSCRIVDVDGTWVD